MVPPIYPIERPHTFCNELRIAPKDHPARLAEPNIGPIAHREKLTPIILGMQNIRNGIRDYKLFLHSSNVMTGVVLDIGYTVTLFVQMYECNVLPRPIAI